MTEWSKITADPIQAPAVAASAPVAMSAPVAPTTPIAGPASPAPMTKDRRASSRGLRSVLGVSVLAAVLASASTVGLLAATRPPAASTAPAAAAATPAAVEAKVSSSDELLPDVVAKARLSVVTITADGVARRHVAVPRARHRRRLRRDPDRRRLHPHEPPRRRGQPVPDRRARPTARSCPPRSSEISDDNDLALIKIDATDLPAATIGDSSALAGRPDRDRDRQPARHLHRDGDPRHHLGARPRDHRPGRGHRPPDPRCTASSRPTPRSIPATAAARCSTSRERGRHQHRDRLERRGPRLRDPDRATRPTSSPGSPAPPARPVMSASISVPAPAWSARRPPAGARAASMHLLLVEDDQRLQRALRRLLEDDRHVVEVASDGETGLAIAERRCGHRGGDPRHRAAGHVRARGRPAPPPQPVRAGDPDAHRARHRQRPGDRPRCRRRRLPGQAVRLRGARGPPPRAGPPLRRPAPARRRSSRSARSPRRAQPPGHRRRPRQST